MPTSVVLCTFTDAGRKNATDTVTRSRATRAENEKRGFQVRGLYWTHGRYALIAVVDAPDEQTMMAGLFNITGAGNVRSEALPAFTDTEMEAIIQKM